MRPVFLLQMEFWTCQFCQKVQFLGGGHGLAVFERTRETRISRGWSTRSL